MKSKDLIKSLIKKFGIEVVLQSIIEMMDESIDATDYDMDSIRNPNDLWKFKVIEGLEHAYEAILKQNGKITIGDKS